jgi:hypothetical protein
MACYRVNFNYLNFTLLFNSIAAGSAKNGSNTAVPSSRRFEKYRDTERSQVSVAPGTLSAQTVGRSHLTLQMPDYMELSQNSSDQGGGGGGYGGGGSGNGGLG